MLAIIDTTVATALFDSTFKANSANTAVMIREYGPFTKMPQMICKNSFKTVKVGRSSNKYITVRENYLLLLLIFEVFFYKLLLILLFYIIYYSNNYFSNELLKYNKN